MSQHVHSRLVSFELPMIKCRLHLVESLESALVLIENLDNVVGTLVDVHA